jgi:hypothetical protein
MHKTLFAASFRLFCFPSGMVKEFIAFSLFPPPRALCASKVSGSKVCYGAKQKINFACFPSSTLHQNLVCVIAVRILLPRAASSFLSSREREKGLEKLQRFSRANTFLCFSPRLVFPPTNSAANINVNDASFLSSSVEHGNKLFFKTKAASTNMQSALENSLLSEEKNCCAMS